MTISEIRFTHFHVGSSSFTDKHGKVHSGKGRLAGTIATTVLPDGNLAVAVARCVSTDAPVRAHGVVRSRARLERFVRSFNGPQGKQTQEAMLKDEISKMLVFRISRENFIELVIKGELFRKLASLSDTDFRGVERMLTQLRAVAL